MDKKIQDIPYSYKEIVEELTAYIEERLNFWNNYVVDSEEEQVKLKDVQLHGSRLRCQAKEDSDLDCVFEYEGAAREVDLFNYMNHDEDKETYTICDIPVDFNPIKSDDIGNMTDYMSKSDKYDEEMLSSKKLKEAITVLKKNGFLVG